MCLQHLRAFVAGILADLRANALARPALTIASVLSLTVSACVDSPATAPNPEALAKASIPAAGAMSKSGPVAGALSSSPLAGQLSRIFADGAGRQDLSASAAASPARRMLWQNTSTGDRSVWLMSGTTWDGSYAALPQVPTDWSIAGTGDFNADGHSDIVWQNTSNGDRSIWFMSGNTWNGSYALLPQVSTQWSIAGAGDFDRDGNPDLVWQNTTTGERSIWFMTGRTWGGAYALLPTVRPEWRIAAAADFDGDGDPDLVWQNIDTGERSIWLMNGSVWTDSYVLLPTVPKQWSIAGVFTASPIPAWSSVASGTSSSLHDAWGTSASDVWAVGDGTIAHYNGTSWSSTSTQPVFGATHNSVWGFSPNNVWTVGQDRNVPGAATFHYNGK